MLLNTNQAEGGVMTRVCPATGNSSCLDFPIGSTSLLPYIRRVLVDSARNYTPKRVVARKGKLTLNYTDHYPIIVDLEIPKASKGMELQKELEWNTSKPGGWKAFKEAGERNAEKLMQLADDDKYSAEELIKKVEKIHEDSRRKKCREADATS